MAEECAILSARPPGNDQAGEKSENGFVRGHSARTGPDDFARGAASGRSQRLSPRTVGGFAASPGYLAGILVARGVPVTLEELEVASVRSFVFLLFPGRKNRQRILSQKLRRRNAPFGGSH